MPDAGTQARAKVPKTIEFEGDQYDELDGLQERLHKPNFSETVRFVVRHGLQRIRALEAEGKLVA